MRLSSLAWRGVSSLPDLECDLISTTTGRPHDLVVISGPAATGKTRLCELMLAVLETVGPYHGMVRAQDWYADAHRGARVELGLWLDDAPDADGRVEGRATQAVQARAVVHFTANGVLSEVDRAIGRQLSRYDHDPAHSKREYFPENRQRAWGARGDSTAALEQSLLRSTNDSQKYSFVPRFLAELPDDPARARVFANGVELLSPTVRYSPVSRTADPTTCFMSRERKGAPYAELSSSEADAVLIAATVAMIGLRNSVAFLDRPELYVSPDRLVAWVRNLAALGDGNQWFVASNDAALAAAVDRSQVISLGQNEAQA